MPRAPALAIAAAMLCGASAVIAAEIRKGELSAQPAATAVLTLAPGETMLDDGAIFYRPASVPEGPRPLLVILHGYGQDHVEFIRLFEHWADRCGAILFAPKHRKETWDIIARAQSLQGRRYTPRNLPKDFGEDAAQIDAHLKTLFSAAPIDPAKVALLGFSDGASYALSLGLPNPDLFPWIISLSPGFALWPERVGLSQRVFIAHGTRDSRLAFANTRDGIVKPMRDAGMKVDFREFDGDHIFRADHVREALQLSTGCARQVAAPTSRRA